MCHVICPTFACFEAFVLVSAYLAVLLPDFLFRAKPDPSSQKQRMMSPIPRAPWASHPCGGNALERLITHYYEQKDVQTVSVLACVALHMYKEGSRAGAHPEVRTVAVMLRSVA